MTAVPASPRSDRPIVRSEDTYARVPKQKRSRVSFDRAMDAAVELLVERRSEAFTLGEVAERAGLSTGSIYGRVDSKDDLLRAAHAREMTRITAEQRRVFSKPPPPDESLPQVTARLVRTLGDLLRQNAPVLAPFMMLANHDSAVADLGKFGHDEMAEAFRAVLLQRRDQILHPDPERAVTWSCTVVYSVLARWLGLGSEPEAAGEGEWELILADLSEMVTAFLLRGASASATR